MLMMTTQGRKKALNSYLRALIDERLNQPDAPSARQLSMSVVGHDGLFRSLKSGGVPGGDTLEALAEALDLEFYFGPKRAAPDAQLEVRAIDGDVVVVPYHETMIRHRFAPMHLAMTRTWIAKSGADLDALRLLVMQSNVMEPTIPDAALVVIDTSHTEPEDGSSELYGVQIKGSGPTIRRLTRIGDKWIMTCDDPRFAKHVITAETPAQRLAAAPIGRVVAVMSRTVTVQD